MTNLSHENFKEALMSFVTQSFRAQESVALVEVAHAFWYGDESLVTLFEEVVDSASMSLTSKKKALYVLDTLRRYPCTSTNKKDVARLILSRHSSLKEVSQNENDWQRVKNYSLDKLAFEWGLSEDVSELMKDVLFYQTRHYAATQKVVTGFNEQEFGKTS